MNLGATGCGRICEESVSNREQTWLQLEAALDPGCGRDGVLLVWKLDGSGRVVKKFI